MEGEEETKKGRLMDREREMPLESVRSECERGAGCGEQAGLTEGCEPKRWLELAELRCWLSWQPSERVARISARLQSVTLPAASRLATELP